MSDIRFIHAFNLIQSIGPKRFQSISLYFKNDFAKAWNANEREFAEAGVPAPAIEDIRTCRKTIDPEKEWMKLEKCGIFGITKKDAEYPELLKETPFPPFILYRRGDALKSGIGLAVVGTRKPTPYGKEATEKIISDLSGTDISIISGLALGIDGIAHKSAIKSGLTTIAVLGSGIDERSVYPDFHKELSRDILKNGGALISEFPPETPGLKHHFPQRNRIIAGMTTGTLVIEAREKSGSLITARYALDSGREVFTVPGSIFSSASFGTHELLREGATPVRHGDDIMNALNIERTNTRDTGHFSGIPQQILSLLETPLPFEILKQKLNIETPALNAALSLLELNEAIADIGNKTYRRK